MARSRLQLELKKKQPFQSPAQEAMLNLVRSSDQFQNRFGRLFRQFGLTSSQYNILAFCGERGNRCPRWKSPTD